MKKIMLGVLTIIFLIGCASRTVPPQVLSQKYINDLNKEKYKCEVIGMAVGISGDSEGAILSARFKVYDMGGNAYKVINTTYGNGLFNTTVEVFKCEL